MLGAGRDRNFHQDIAEIAVHHAYYVRAVRERIAGDGIEPFVFTGDDWFAIDASTMAWPAIQALVADQHGKLEALVANVEAGRTTSKLGDAERFNNVLGIACHAIYHAGQVQLIKALKTSRAWGPGGVESLLRQPLLFEACSV